MRALALATAFAVASLNAASAQDDAAAEFVSPCENEAHRAFDFWVGEWVAFNPDTGVVQGYDDVQVMNRGCVVFQTWTQLNDRFRAEGADFRYAGVSFNSVLQDGRWQQIWVGNWGGTFTLTGGLNEEGTMVLSTGPTAAPNNGVGEQRWYWDPQDDGTILSWGEWRTRGEDGVWSEPRVTWNLRYVPRADAPELVAAPASASE